MFYEGDITRGSPKETPLFVRFYEESLSKDSSSRQKAYRVYEQYEESHRVKF